MPSKAALNQYNKIQNHLPSAEVLAGSYKGYLIQYDWSGQNVIAIKKLSLNLAKQDIGLIGGWTEEGTDSVALQAEFKNDSIIFKNTKYKRKDHYSPDSGINYYFQGAGLNLVRKCDTIFIAGSVCMFSPDRGEFLKPLFVALESVNRQTADPAIALRASPNPFTTTLNIDFSVPTDGMVEAQLLNAGGQWYTVT